MNTSWLQSRLNDIYALHKKTIEDYGTLVASLNEECDILCEVIPGYKITSNMIVGDGAAAAAADDGKPGQRKQKEVYNVEKLESESLKQYSHFLDLITKLQKKPHPEEQALGSRLCCKLLPAASHFNYNDRLLRLAVNFANAKATRVAQPALAALSTLLDGEMVSETTQCVVDAILEIVRKTSHALNPKLLTLLLSIRVAMIDVHKEDIAEQKAKDKRMKKEDKELARQLRKASARKDRAELASRQTRILNRVFVIYLRVLQASGGCAREHQAKILAPTLEGLVKFAPLVNQELFRELSTALKELLNIRSKKAVQQDILARKYRDYATVQLGNGDDDGNGDARRGKDELQQQEPCPTTVALHAIVAAAALATKDETLDAADWKEDLVDYQEKLFQLLPDALLPPPLPKPPSAAELAAAEEEAHAQQEQGGGGAGAARTLSGVTGGSSIGGKNNNSDARSTSSVISTTSSLASTAFSIAQSMANHTQYVRGSVIREWTYRCNLVVRAFDSLILSQRHLPVQRVAALVRRVMNLSVGCPHHIAMSLAAMCHRAVIRFPAVGAMFLGGSDHEGGSGSAGAFRFDAEELSGGNPDGVFAWETTLWRNSYQPALRDLGTTFTGHYQRVALTKPGMPPPVSKQLDGVFPDEVLDRFDPSAGLIVPPPQLPRNHKAQRRQRDH